MNTVVTLIGNPRERLTLDHARAAQAALAVRWPPDWLAEDEACDLLCDAPPREAEAAVRAALAGAALDIAAQPRAGRTKRLLIADMDSTVIGCECIDELADMAGLKPQVSEITERAMRGDLAFEPALRERVALLKGLPESVLQSVFDERVRLNPGARTLVHTMRAQGAFTALVSGGFTFFTARVADAAGFQTHQANVLGVADGALTGTVAEPILGREAKLAALRSLAAEHGVPLAETLAVGDGANDLAMVQAAGLGVAYHAKPVVAAQAAARIDHGDLTALLYLQGVRKSALIG